MKMKNKFISKLAVFGLILGMAASMPAYADEPPQVEISADKTSVNAGDEINVTVNLPGVSEKSCAAACRVSFDNTVFELTDFELPKNFENCSVSSGECKDANQKGFFNCLFTSDTGDNLIDFSKGIKVSMKFKAKAGASDGTYSFKVEPKYTTIDYFDEGILDSVSLVSVPENLTADVKIGSGGSNAAAGSASGTDKGSEAETAERDADTEKKGAEGDTETETAEITAETEGKDTDSSSGQKAEKDSSEKTSGEKKTAEKSEKVKTGDETQFEFYALLLICSAAVITTLLIAKKKMSVWKTK